MDDFFHKYSRSNRKKLTKETFNTRKEPFSTSIFQNNLFKNVLNLLLIFSFAAMSSTLEIHSTQYDEDILYSRMTRRLK